ncbi:MAG: ribonuclease H family protein [Fibrobacteria bacterium]|nr:ribonuclease H family protein [Fibrobacteria bacterium]
MPGKKVYAAIYEDKSVTYFNNWPLCQKSVSGKSNVLFKGFKSREEAESWVKSNTKSAPPLSSNTIRIYVDGSYDVKCPKAGWGWIAVKNGEKVAEAYGTTAHDALSRNIDGELEAAFLAAKWAFSQGVTAVIVHDYSGIAQWANGNWKAKSQVAIQYLKNITPLKNNICFEKVEGHSGDIWNDCADELAKQGIVDWKKKNKR